MPEQPTHTFFNSRCAEYKTPFGAVPAGQTVTWRLTVPERLGYVDPHLVLTKDREDPVHYRMNFDGQTPGVNHFVFQLAPTTSGLYFYHFDLYTDFRKIYRTANGEGELTWVNGLDWQLTVYEPDFKTPDWIKDGTMYQIFPDRFCEGVENKPMPFADRIYQADKHAEPFWQPNEVGGHLNEDYFGGDLEGIRIKLPYLLSVQGPSLVTDFVKNVNNFNVIYLLTQGVFVTQNQALAQSNAKEIDLLVTWLFRLTQDYYNYKMAAVLGIMVFIVCAVFTVVCFHFINKKEAMFS